MEFTFNQGVSNSVWVGIKDAEGTILIADYLTLPESNPARNNNYLAIWEAKSENIAWDAAPDWVIPATSSTNEGTDIFSDNLELMPNTSYIVGYSLQPINTSELKNNFCAMAYMKSVDKFADFTTQQVELYVKNIDPRGTYVTIGYNLLKGYNPAINNNWVGVWRESDNYRTSIPKCFAKITDSQDEFFKTLRLKLASGITYKAYFFVGGYDESADKLNKEYAASTISFSAGKFNE